MEEINVRVREFRKTLGLSQAKFAKGISLSSSYLAEMELGTKRVNDRILRLICTQYNGNRDWFLTGEGEMFAEETDPRLQYIVSCFEQLRPELREYILQEMDNLIAMQDKLANK